MSSALCNKTVAILATDGFEQSELTEPKMVVEQASATTRLLSLKDGEIQGMHHDKPGDCLKVDGRVADANVDEYDALILSGGVANPDALRTDEAAMGFVRDLAHSGKSIGVICHRPWTMIEADVVRVRRMTSWPSVRQYQHLPHMIVAGEAPPPPPAHGAPWLPRNGPSLAFISPAPAVSGPGNGFDRATGST